MLLALQLEIGRAEALYATGLMIRRVRGLGAEAKDLVQIPISYPKDISDRPGAVMLAAWLWRARSGCNRRSQLLTLDTH